MDKILILTKCQACSGQAYVPTGEEIISMSGHKYIRHKRCPDCNGSGLKTHWVPLDELARMLTAIAAEGQEV